ncbi:MAG: hypothetical protein Q8O65_05130 [Nitrosopumilaceae archaeon]|nr:hypothetical protein [Nitrosopumilaceae archaeon]
MGSGSYTRAIGGIHRSYATALKQAKSRQSVLNAYWKHKRDHEKLLRQHLREEMNDVKRIKGRMKYR